MEKMHNQKVYIFDFDGTLADTLAVFLDVLHINRKKFGIKDDVVLDDSFVAKFRKMTLRAVIKEFEISLVKIPFLLKFMRYELSKNIEKVKPFENVSEVLQNLKDQGHIIGVLTTNSKENVKAFFELNHFPKVDFVYSERSVFGKHKSLQKILRKENIIDREVYYIGDETRDITAAKKVGLVSVGVTWGYNDKELLEKENPDHLISNINDLLNL